MHIKDLERPWNQVEQSLRRLVQRSTRERIQWTEEDDIDAFCLMHEQTYERKSLSRPSFERYSEHRPQDSPLHEEAFGRSISVAA